RRPVIAGQAADRTGELPAHRMLLGGREHWFFSEADADAFRSEQQQKLGHELMVADEPSAAKVTKPASDQDADAGPSANGASGQGEPSANGTNGQADAFSVQELHEVKTVNKGLERLRTYGLAATDLVHSPRIAGREPAPRFFLENGDKKQVLPHL